MNNTSREALKKRIKNCLMVYHDPDRRLKGLDSAYLRFVPLETERFRHGLSVNVTVPNGMEDEMKDLVADYLADAFESLAK